MTLGHNMTNEKTFFLRVLSDHIHRRATEPPRNMDWAVFCEYAQNHQVSGIVYERCKAFLPEKWRELLGEKNAAEVFYFQNRIALLTQIAHSFSEVGIPFYTVKGLNVAQLYPIPALRTMGDCDIIVHPEDKERAHDVFVAVGFEPHSREDMEWAYWKNGIEFELHDHLLYDEIVNDEQGIAFSEKAWDHAQMVKGSQFALDWSFHFVFLLLHLRKHILGSGVGFRQFMDLDVVMRRCALDWAWINTALETLGLVRFARVCFGLLNRWFETPLPFPCEEMEEGFYEEATNKIFANGIFGFHDKANRENRALNAITQKSGRRWHARLSNLLQSIFPPYRHMRYVPQYSYINGRPWLLPTAWIYRFYRGVRYRMIDNGKRMMGNVFVSNEKLDARERELAKWGL